MATSTIYPIPGYLGQLQVAASTSYYPRTFGTALPFWSFEYGGSCQPRGIYLASGIPYPDVFPERQTLTAWSFTGPARTDFNPNDPTVTQPYIPGGLSLALRVGQLIAAKFTLYGGAANVGPQIGGSPAAFVADYRVRGHARGQSIWETVLVAAWTYEFLGGQYSGQIGSSGVLFRGFGTDTSYSIPQS